MPKRITRPIKLINLQNPTFYRTYTRYNNFKVSKQNTFLIFTRYFFCPQKDSAFCVWMPVFGLYKAIYDSHMFYKVISCKPLYSAHSSECTILQLRSTLSNIRKKHVLPDFQNPNVGKPKLNGKCELL
jgi:hypothetical protein